MTSLVFYSHYSQNPLHLGGGRPLSVRLRLPPLPSRESLPHRGKQEKIDFVKKSIKKVFFLLFLYFIKNSCKKLNKLAFPFGEGVNEVDGRGL